ncbi:sensor histidine kinase [Kineosporia succinea]|uniref:GAF domain-containing protein n=1 Tax=Kineosporia succinea TaxID=84632 RepID=A0ABT9PF14_9ACTN|nr:GAF domain-containing protein [Kineosporia succinea]MDP9831076.1 GAF domain-containing protein [Kineosporia succinea]
MTEQRDTTGDFLTFPDLPRLELDQLLGQLIERANEVMGTQGRLRGLLRANQLVNGGLTLNTVLRRVVEAACELVGARYGALGVIAPSGGLAEFVHVGMDPDTVAAIGGLPEGNGLLGALIDAPEPIRLRRIEDDPRSRGFPPRHPPMQSFLGVPVIVRGEVFGNLYLADGAKGAFSSEDEELARALAATAGVAIDNARLYESARTQGEWLRANAEIASCLLSEEPAELTLHLIAERSLRIAQADLVALVLPDEDDAGLVQIKLAAGDAAEAVTGQKAPRSSTLAGRVLVSGVSMRVANIGDVDGVVPSRALDRDVGPALVVPMLGSRGVRGVLSLIRSAGARPFTAEDESLAGGFANQAAIAMELAENRAERERLAVLDERQRIADDLHDHVIQQLFADGLTLQSITGLVPAGRVHETVERVIDDLDDTIARIRSSIFRLGQGGVEYPGHGARSRLLNVVDAATPVLGFTPAVHFSGMLDQLRGSLVDDLVAVLREGLSNVSRHARASAVQVSVRVSDVVTVVIEDDGTGIRADVPRSGLNNLGRRAERAGGSMLLERGERGGTRFSWTAVVNRTPPAEPMR